ncbi:SDR family NAD(P)-dependent oxidoreductase [Nocardia ignorata]|uniref:Short-subunit dehydrogenase n=1 Tax=Nocardia ignorata TaxID=145285 RepID=A0A4V3CMF7_NOCIG|nr:SDR family NAD(P)-dependent oxidoreductase [Nocardia ignorata]TDP28695.1 short-subunit dehydrogenase [Nocardia ignorata]
MKTAIVTGASSGIGRAVAAALVARGYHVLGTSRDSSTVADPVPGVDYRDLDLTDRGSIARFVDALDGTAVDVLVNNAGESQCGPLEELPMDAVRRLFQLNVFGAVELIQLLLPRMRERGRGKIVNIGSMLASFPLAYRASYVATKAALKGFATAARYELKPYGIDITTVEPGSIATGLSGRRTKYLGDDSPYRARFTAAIAALDAKEAEGISADDVARTVLEAVEAAPTLPLYAVGSHAPVVFLAQRLLPRRVIEAVVAWAYGGRSAS